MSGIIDIKKRYDIDYKTLTATPEGQFKGVLVDKAWGNRGALFVFFVNTDTKEKYRLTVFNNNKYMAYEGSDNFKEAELNQEYLIITSRTRNGNIKFQKSKLL